MLVKHQYCTDTLMVYFLRIDCLDTILMIVNLNDKSETLQEVIDLNISKSVVAVIMIMIYDVTNRGIISRYNENMEFIVGNKTDLIGNDINRNMCQNEYNPYIVTNDEAKQSKCVKNCDLQKLERILIIDGKFQKKCPLSSKNAPIIDYKNVSLLKKYITDNGKIVSSKISSVSFNKQKKLTKEIKKAKILGLL